MTYFIYKITNLANKKIYIGKTKNIKNRWAKHKTSAKKQDPHDYTYLHRALNKYGFDKFIIEQIDEFSIEDEALAAEIKYINIFNSKDKNIGYNLTNGGEGSSGYKHTEEAKKLMSKIKSETYIGENNPFFNKTHTKEVKSVLSDLASERVGELNPFFGKIHTKASREKMSINYHKKEKYLTDADIENIKYKKLVLNMTYKEIATEYNLHWKTISNAVNGKKAYKIS